MDQFILFASAVVLSGFLLIPVSARLGAPILLLVLFAGMLLGEDGPGRIQFNDFELAYGFGSIALAVILFAGGLETKYREVVPAAIPSIILATAGVALTAIAVGIPVAFLLDVPLEQGLLLGAVVGSTDAAATFLLIQQGNIALKSRLKNTLILESGINDPMAIFLTIALTMLVDAGDRLTLGNLADYLPEFARQIGYGLVIGIAGGFAFAALFNRLRMGVGLYPPMALVGGFFVFALANLVGGSGFLAIYLTGLVLSARLSRATERVIQFHEGLQWLSQIALFFMLGLLVTPSALGKTLLPALAIAAILMFVARPLAVFACTLPFRYTVRERLYLSWVGLRGAVPIFLAIVPVITPGPISVEFFNIVFVVVVTSLIFQGWTVAASARWLKVEEPQAA
jgi:cell volume regulation protein A